MINRVAYKGEKRQKERARLQKVEEKRLRRLAKRDGDPSDTDSSGDEDDTAEETTDTSTDTPGDAPSDAPAETP